MVAHPSPDIATLVVERDAADSDAGEVRPITMARAKLRRFIERVGITVAVQKTQIPRSTLLALRLGTLDDPKVSVARVLRDHAGIAFDDWWDLIPALRRPGS